VVPGDHSRNFAKYIINILADFKPEERRCAAANRAAVQALRGTIWTTIFRSKSFRLGE
jgi:hypothetical protein